MKNHPFHTAYCSCQLRGNKYSDPCPSVVYRPCSANRVRSSRTIGFVRGHDEGGSSEERRQGFIYTSVLRREENNKTVRFETIVRQTCQNDRAAENISLREKNVDIKRTNINFVETQ